jgi:hypothetical protein
MPDFPERDVPENGTVGDPGSAVPWSTFEESGTLDDLRRVCELLQEKFWVPGVLGWNEMEYVTLVHQLVVELGEGDERAGLNRAGFALAAFIYVLGHVEAQEGRNPRLLTQLVERQIDLYLDEEA